MCKAGIDLFHPISCLMCCSNTGLGQIPGSLCLWLPLLRPLLSTGLVSSQLPAWRCPLRRASKAKMPSSTNASHCQVSLLPCNFRRSSKSSGCMLIAGTFFPQTHQLMLGCLHCFCNNSMQLINRGLSTSSSMLDVDCSLMERVWYLTQTCHTIACGELQEHCCQDCQTYEGSPHMQSGM